jgi:hypothetical protein
MGDTPTVDSLREQVKELNDQLARQNEMMIIMKTKTKDFVAKIKTDAQQDKDEALLEVTIPRISLYFQI